MEVNSRDETRVSLSERGASLADEAYEWTLLRIVRGEFAPGGELKSTLVARAMQVSRTPVIQALHRLAADGIVTLEMNKRAVVRPGAENWLVEVHQLRELLEPHAAAMAATRMAQPEIDKLRQLAAAVAPPADEVWTDAWIAQAERFDFAFHLSIADSTANLVLTAAIRKCWSFKRVSYLAAQEAPASLARAHHEHVAILDALAARDAETAAVAMRFHLRSAAHRRPASTIV